MITIIIMITIMIIMRYCKMIIIRGVIWVQLLEHALVGPQIIIAMMVIVVMIMLIVMIMMIMIIVMNMMIDLMLMLTVLMVDT